LFDAGAFPVQVEMFVPAKADVVQRHNSAKTKDILLIFISRLNCRVAGAKCQ
jgi:hypothetical protein